MENKTVKLNEKVIYLMKRIQTKIYEDYEIKLKTYNDVIEFLHLSFLAAQTDERILKFLVKETKEKNNNE